MDNNNPTQTIAYFLAKDMLEHMDSWRKRIYRLRKNAKNFLVYKGEPDTYINKEYPQGVDVPVEVVEGIWHEVRIGNVVMDKAGEWFSISWYASIEDLGQYEQWKFVSELVAALCDNFGGDGSMDEIREELAQPKGHGRALFKSANGGKNISIPKGLLQKLVAAVDHHEFCVGQDENGERRILTTLSKEDFWNEIWSTVA